VKTSFGHARVKYLENLKMATNGLFGPFLV
jgi:hypothetical protein